MGRATAIAATVLAAASIVPAGAARALPDPTAAQVVTVLNHYAPGDTELALPTLVVLAGTRLEYTNLDALAAHDVTDEGCRTPGDACLFRSPSIGRSDGTVEVAGVAELGPGTYEFYCTVHPSTMFGTLIVEESL